MTQWSVTAAAACAFALLYPAPGRDQGQATPAATVKTFVSAITRSDTAAAAACVVDGKPAMAAIVSAQVAKMGGNLRFSAVKQKVTGAAAVVTATGTTGEKGAAGRNPFKSVVRLRKVGPAWRIVAPGAEFARSGRKPASDIVNYLAIYVSNPGALSAGVGAAHGNTCLSNMKQIALACLMQAQDNRKTFRLTPASWQKSLAPYARNASIFRCPSHGVYSLNPAISGKRLAAVSRPAQTVLAYEGAGGKLAFRHEGTASVAFVDGHCARVTPAQAASLRWKP